jgi:hypothetical protein
MSSPLLTFPLSIPATFGWPLKQTAYGTTITQHPASGRGDIRIPTMLYPRWKFSLDLSFLKGDATGVNTNWQLWTNFFIGVQFGAADWLLLHPYDNIIGSYKVTGAVTSGVFFPDEQVVQATSGAAAQMIGSTFGIGPLLMGPITGTPDGTHGWVGQQSGAVFTPSATPVVNTSQAIATGDGTTTEFSIIRTFVVGGAQELIQNFSVGSPQVFLNGALQSSSLYSIDEYGTITFTTAPGAGVVISWIGQFYYRCHLLKDEFDDLSEDYYQLWSCSSVEFESSLL